MPYTPSPTAYPFASHFLDRGGVRLHYLDEGDRQAPPVLMLHGNPTWSFLFRNLITALRGTHRVIVPDHIGCGLSDKPGDDRYDYTLASRVADVKALVDSLGLTQPLTLLAHDWGGMIGMAWAVRHPERVARLVLCNTGAFRNPAAKRFPASLALCRAPLLGALLVRGFNAFCLESARTSVTRRPLSAEARAGLLGPYDSWANRIAIHRFVQDIPMRPGDRAWPLLEATEAGIERFREAGTPTLLLWGMRDFVFDAHFLDEFIRRLPQAEVHRFEDAGHYLFEDAAEETTRLVRGFLGAA